MRRSALALETAVALLLASIRLVLSSEDAVPALLGRSTAAPDVGPSSPGSEARRVGRAVRRVAPLMPWRPRCLPQAVATRMMLRRRGIPHQCHLGIVSTAPVTAHAWVTVHGVVIVGGPVDHATPIATFS